MTSTNDSILKAWLRTLRYTIEYYEDTFDSKNNRQFQNNRGAAKNMLLGRETNEDSDEEHYVNVWECTDGEKSASKLKNSLESVGDNSEVSAFEGDNATYSLITELSAESYVLDDVTKDLSETTDLVEDSSNHKPQKPRISPRISKDSSRNEVIYANLPLRPQILTVCPDSNRADSENAPIYENLPLRPQKSTDTEDSTQTSPIYENLRFSPRNSFEYSSDDSDFEEAVCSTIQYLENVLDSVDTYSDDCDSDEREASSTFNTFESNVSSVTSRIEESCSLSAQNIEDDKFTESSSSFEEYVSTEGLNSSNYSDIERFAKDSRISAFFEESEPLLPQEVKAIPIPKSTGGPQSRFSAPTGFRDVSVNIRRPQSLRSPDIEEFEDFKEYLRRDALNSSKTSDSFKEPVARQVREDSTTQNLNVSFAKECRISALFEEGEVQELEVHEVAPQRLRFEGKRFVEALKDDLLMWMADLVGEYCGEKLDIMEEKELLKSINQFPKDRSERRSENKFPIDDDNVEVRRNPSIQRNRISKTTDFDLGRRRLDSPINPKNFDIRGIVKFQLPHNTIITKLNQEHVAYENENFYRINDKTKAKVLLTQNVHLKSARYLNSRSKESKEVELKDSHNLSYILYFDSIKYAKQFMDSDKIQGYVSDNKVTIKKTLLRFLGKRSSREILEKKGIYKNEPIFGNTLRDIYLKGAATSGSPVPMFIYRVIELIEKLENIKSLGLYRTSGNLATIQKIRFEVDNGRLEILDHFSRDPDVLTGSLKLFFRELKEPLIPCDVCDKLIEVTKMDPKKMSSKDHQKVRSTLMKNLYEANVETFYVVMRHLLEVVKYKEHNKMDAYNLAICWGPSMIFSVHGVHARPTIELSRDIVTQSHDATRLVDFLLGYYELYPAELHALSKRPESVTDKILSLKRQESRDSVESSDSLKSQKKSSSNLSLSIDEITRKLVEAIEPNLSCEGLYKKPGTPDKTGKIMKKLNKKKINELDKYKTDVHDMTDALKKYLREQEGLLTKDIVELVLKATSDSSQSYLEPVTRRKVTALIEESPKKDTLIYVLRHLAKVIDHQTRHHVSKNDIIGIWTDVLNHQRKCQVTYEQFGKFLTVAVEVFNDNLPDIVRSSFNNNGSSPNRNEIMGEVVKQMKNQQERDRNSRYDNVDCDVSGEASVLDEKTEQTKL